MAKTSGIRANSLDSGLVKVLLGKSGGLLRCVKEKDGNRDYTSSLNIGSAHKLVKCFARNTLLTHSVCKMSNVLGTFANKLCDIIYERSRRVKRIDC